MLITNFLYAGFVVPGAYYPTVISSGVLNPVKTRRLLQVRQNPPPAPPSSKKLERRITDTETLIRIEPPTNPGTLLYPCADPARARQELFRDPHRV